MINFLRRSPPATSQPPGRHIEIWAELVTQNRFLRRALAAGLALAFLALAAGTYGLLVGLYRPLAFQVTSDGHASYAGRLHDLEGPSEVEARYVAKEFLRRYLAFNSLTIESDLAAAWNLMTDELQREQRAT